MMRPRVVAQSKSTRPPDQTRSNALELTCKWEQCSRCIKGKGLSLRHYANDNLIRKWECCISHSHEGYMAASVDLYHVTQGVA